MGEENVRKEIYITDFDLERLKGLIESAEITMGRDSKHLVELESELRRAKVVDSKDIPRDVITMNSQVDLTDVDTGKKMILTLVFPPDADMDKNKISILAPVGTAMIGYGKGDIIEWPVPAGRKRLRVDGILYQPESAGDYHL
ncbi:MAG: nucleoside diphosphate kinase regulator [Actinobacteria bacterium]|nr:nucleoside diphosphate kinase regulator [Actinomycetota bacterium]